MAEFAPGTDPYITHRDILNMRKAIAATMAIAYFSCLTVHDKIDDFVRRDFYSQYLAEGRCMTNSRYVGGKIAVSGFMGPGETTVTVSPNASSFALATKPIMFITGQAGYIPVNPEAVAAVRVYHCPEGVV